MSAVQTNWRRWGVLAAKILIVALLVWGVRRSLVTGFAQLTEQAWDPRSVRLGWLLAAAALYLIGTLPAGLLWHRAMRALGGGPRLFPTLRAYYIGHLGKYVPGKAMVVVLRTAFVRGESVDVSAAAAAVFFETLSTMAIGAFVAGAVLAVWFHDQQFLLFVAVGLLVVAGLPVCPPVFRRLARLAGVGRTNPQTAQRLAQLEFRSFAGGWSSVALGWIVMSASLWAVLRALPGGEELSWWADLPICAAGVSLAVVAGFLSLIPGGVVVREAILLQLLAPRFGEGRAMVAAILLRMVWLVAELAISGILYTIRPHRSPPEE